MHALLNNLYLYWTVGLFHHSFSINCVMHKSTHFSATFFVEMKRNVCRDNILVIVKNKPLMHNWNWTVELFHHGFSIIWHGATRVALTNGFGKVIASLENIHKICYLMNVISIVTLYCHANIVSLSVMTQGWACPLHTGWS